MLLKRHLRRHRVLVGTLLTLAATGGYAFGVEPLLLDVTHHTVAAPVARSIVVAHVTDLHTHGHGTAWREERLLAALEREAPDVIVVTGDTVDRPEDAPHARTLLSRMHAPLGVWTVPGNWEHWSDAPPVHGAEGPVRTLVNEAVHLREEVWLVGLDDAIAGAPDAPRALAPVPDGAAVLAMFHAPVGVDLVRSRAHVAFAGHTHGGQIRAPFLPPFWLPPGSGRFVEGWYDELGTKMYVSRGVGNSLLEARFLCRPELAIVRVTPR